MPSTRLKVKSSTELDLAAKMAHRIKQIEFLKPRTIEDAEAMIPVLDDKIGRYNEAFSPWRTRSGSLEDAIAGLADEVAQMDLSQKVRDEMHSIFRAIEGTEKLIARTAMENLYMDVLPTALRAESGATAFAREFIEAAKSYTEFDAAGKMDPERYSINPYEYMLNVYEFGFSSICRREQLIPGGKKEILLVYVPLEIHGIKQIGAYFHGDEGILYNPKVNLQ
jgi:hypothetical protein